MAKWENTPGRGNAICRQGNQPRNLEDSGQIKDVCITITGNTLTIKIIEQGVKSVYKLEILNDIRIFYY